MRKVYQYTLEGRYLGKHKSITKAAEMLRADESTIRKAIKRNKPALGFYWKTAISDYKEDAIIKEESTEVNKTYPDRYERRNTDIRSNNGNILVIGDTHFPFEIDGYLEHCIMVRDKFNCKTVVHIGDIIDNHASSFHDSDPDGFGGGAEMAQAKDKLQAWYKAFPEMHVCLGNHDQIPFRKAFKSGLPSTWIKSYEDILEAPEGWKFSERWIIDDVIFEHGTGTSGDMGALNRAKESRQSTVIGHSHSFAGVRYLASRKNTIFGMNVGCGIDEDKYAFAYAKYQARRPVVACGVVHKGSQGFVLTMD